ncbi:hypothetical protein [Paractinoplanes maris]|uniref:hypothetical protein n=1 Tax=Paractinoplanes maris TaxID=1734446 RepID=UPI002021C03E|nr:hypothetical protein [Actinoplanes maris]
MEIAEPLDRTDCYGVLKPYLPALDDSFRAAMQRWQAWLGKLDGSPADVSARSRANTLYDFIVVEVTKRFAPDPHVRVRKERGFLVVRFHDLVAMRFKKFRSNTLKTSSVATAQSLAFSNQTLEISEVTIQPMTHVVAGYLLDDLDLNIAKVAVTCTMFGDHLWAPIQISGTVAPVAAVPQVSTEAAPAPRVRSKRVKKIIDDGQQAAGGSEE